MKDKIQSVHQNDTKKQNTIMVLFLIAYLLFDFLPSFKTIERTSPQYLYLAITNLIAGVYFYCNSQNVPSNLVGIFKKSILFKIYIAFLFLCGVSIISAGNVSLALVSYSKLLIVFCMFLNFTVLLYNKPNLQFQIAFIIGMVTVIQSLVILYDFYNTLNLTEIKGNAGNINILAASLNIKIPFLIIGILHFTNRKKILLILALLLSTVIIFLTSSRAILLGLIILLIVFLIFYVKVYIPKRNDFIKIAFILLPVLISFITVNLIFEKVGDSERYKSIGSRVSQIEINGNPEDTSSKTRLQFWGNALKIINKNTLTGVGLGNWKIADLPYENTFLNDSDVSGNAHNDFLEITAETGVLNGLIYISLFLFVFFANLKRVLHSAEKEKRLAALLSLMLLCSYLLDAVFNFPLYIPKMQLGFCFLLALTLVNSTVSEKTTSNFSISNLVLCSIAISLITAYFAYSQFRAEQLEFKFKVSQALYRQNNGSLPPTEKALKSNEIIAHLPKFPTVSFYSEPFVEFAGESLFYEKKYSEALKYFKQAQKINPFLGNSDWYIHKIELEKGNLDSAYVYIKKAYSKRPRNRDFYLSTLLMAHKKKDTLGILKFHRQFTKYRNTPESWDDAYKALNLSGYQKKKLLLFLDQGLKVFPKDSLLMLRKSNLIFTERDQYLLMAQQYGKEAKLEKALEYYKKALNEDQDNQLVIQNIGVSYFKLNQYKNAISYLSKIENAADLNDGKTEYVLALSYAGLNDKQKACSYLNLAREKNFSNAEKLLQQLCK